MLRKDDGKRGPVERVTGKLDINLDPQLTRWAGLKEPGCALGLIDNGKLVFNAGFGVEDLKARHPITYESRFDIGSEAKQFTAACIALIELEGRIAADDEIGQILPGLPETFRRISIEQLLHHTSGIPDFFPVLRERDMLNDPCVLQTVYEVICQLRSTEFPPGDRFAYSNSGYALLARIAEQVEGTPFREIIQRRIFGPLRMNDSLVHDTPGATYAHHAKGHWFEEGSGYRECWHPGYAVPGAGCLYSSVRDLARWMAGLHGGALAGPELLRRMLRPGRLNDSSETRYGWGLDWGQCFNAPAALSIIAHSGTHGGSRAIMLHAPRHGFSIILLCNNRRIDHARIALEMAGQLAG